MKQIKLNSIQYKFWMDNQLKYPSAEYNNVNFTFVVEGALDLKLLRESYWKIMLEYPPFCSTVHVHDTVPYFEYNEYFDKVPFEIVTRLNTLRELDQYIYDKIHIPFDLAKDIPCRFYAILFDNKYYLVHLFNHIVLDGICLPLFFDRVSTIYSNLKVDTYQPVSQLDLIEKFNNAYEKEHLEKNDLSVKYWKEFIKDYPLHLPLPKDSTNVNQPIFFYFKGGKELRELSVDFCSNNHTTLFRLYSAVWALTLTRLTRNNRLLLDHTVNLRPKGNNTLFGVFVNNLPMKFNFEDDNLCIFDILKELRINRQQERLHQDTVYYDIFHDESSPNTSNFETINVAVSYPSRFKTLTWSLEDCKISSYGHVDVQISADLALLVEDDEDLTCDIRHNPLIPRDYVDSLSVTFLEILRQVLLTPSIKIKDISLIPKSEQNTILRIENNQLHLANKPECFLHRFNDIVRTNPMAIAVEYKEKSLTYIELDRRSNHICRYLVDHNLSHKRIGISTPKNIEMIIGILGILKAGSSYVPIDYQYPSERINFIIQDSNVAEILTTQLVPNNFAVTYSRIEDVLRYTGNDDFVPPIVYPIDEAYVIYTSGTTGKPKGIPICHANLFQTITTNIEIQHLNSHSRVLQFANICFDASIVELFPVLTIGGTLVLPTDEIRKDSRLLLSFLEDHKISSLNIPPVLLASLPHQELPLLKTIVIGGDTTSLDAIKYWSVNRLFINAYGPTENTVDTTYSVINPDSSITDIGTSMPGVTCYIVDKYMNLMPHDVVGELCIGGVKLTEGYINRPELNKEKFIKNPFATKEDIQKGINTRLYKTGDLAIRRKDGHLIFCGRADFQVKLHGYRIELGDIESKIRTFDALITNTIVTTYGTMENKKIVAYLQTKEPEMFNVSALKDYLMLSLPVYMVPAKFIVLENFVYNTSGKIDRNNLPDPALFHEERPELVELETPTEKTLAELWKKFLPTNQIGREDDFMALGGDSMGVIQLSFTLEETFKVLVRASDIYNHSTLHSLASFIDNLLHAKSEEEFSETEHKNLDSHLPLTPMQLALWLQCAQSEAVKDTYNLPCFFQCPDNVSIERLEEALNLLVSKQEGFRMSFPLNEKGKPYIHIADFTSIHFEQIHLQSEQELADVFQQKMKISFNLEQGPLFTCSLFIVNDHTYYCCIILHHLISDGWSAKLIQRTLLDYVNGNPINWQKFDEGYMTYVNDLEEFLVSNAYSQRLTYWKKKLHSISDLEILKSKRDVSDDSLASYYECPFPKELKEAVTSFCNRHVYTPFTVYISLYLMVLARISRQSDFVVGFPYMGRDLGNYSHMVGFFVKTLPLRYQRDYGNLPFLTYVDIISKELLDISENAVSLDKLTKMARSQSDDENLDFVQTIFSYEDKELFHTFNHYEHTSFGLTFSILNKNSESSCLLTYKKSCYDKRDIKTLVSAFFTLLESAISSEDIPLKKLSLADESYCKKIICSNCCTLGLRDETLSRLTVPDESFFTNIQPFLKQFRQIVGLMPEKEAMRFNGISMTYRELDEFSNQIATNIRKAGVLTASSIAVNINASIHSIVVMIGILKAGCCYVPIAEDIPDDRKSLMLEDASCKMLFTNENFPEGECIVEHKENTQNVDFTNCAYIIYTSGTTGKPKGVPITHDSLAHLIIAGAKGYSITSSSRVLLFASISFDASVDEIFIPLAQGATIVIASKEQRLDVNLLSQLMLSEFVTFACIPAALLPLLPHTNFPELKTLVNGGESANPTVIKKWLGNRQVINSYGPTENTVDATMGIVNENSEPDDIGLPLTGCTCYVLDEELNIVPDGVEGELCIGGLQLTSGYLNRPDLNNEMFVDNPYVLPEDKANGLNLRLYKSGDIVVRRENGHLIFRGRKDRQIKLHGFRIELAEIEKQILANESVEQVFVQIRKDEATSYNNKSKAELVAYIGSSHDVDLADLQHQLREKLPVYMVPTRWAVIERLPLTMSGKIDKRALPEPFYIVQQEREIPMTNDEELFVKLLREFFGTDTIGVETDLIELGITSLQIMEFVVYASERSDFHITLSSVYRSRTIRNLVKDLNRKFYFWANEYDKGKPTFVFICGLPYFRPFYDDMVTNLKDRCNLFIMESYVEYFQNRNSVSLDDLIQFYMDVIKVELQDKPIFAVTGYCIGSEIAIRLATRLKEEGVSESKVLMLEGFWDREIDENDNILLKVVTNPAVMEQCLITDKLFKTYRPINFDGELIMAFSEKMGDKMTPTGGEDISEAEFERVNNSMKENQKRWKKAYPNAPFYILKADHWTFFEKQHVDFLWNAMKTHWNL